MSTSETLYPWTRNLDDNAKFMIGQRSFIITLTKTTNNKITRQSYLE